MDRPCVHKRFIHMLPAQGYLETNRCTSLQHTCLARTNIRHLPILKYLRFANVYSKECMTIPSQWPSTIFSIYESSTHRVMHNRMFALPKAKRGQPNSAICRNCDPGKARSRQQLRSRQQPLHRRGHASNIHDN